MLKLQSAGEAERSGLSHELHDDIAQKLAALKSSSSSIKLLGQNRRTAAHSVAAVDGLIADIREMSRSLRPAPFEEGQLIPALAMLARTEGRRAGLRVLIDAPTGDVTLSRDAELARHRVVREAVTNIVKHARAHHLESVGADPRRLVLGAGRGRWHWVRRGAGVATSRARRSSGSDGDA